MFIFDCPEEYASYKHKDIQNRNTHWKSLEETQTY